MIKAIFFDLCGVVITLGDNEFINALSKEIKVKPKDVEELFYKYLRQNEIGRLSEDQFYGKIFEKLKVEFDLEKTKEIRTSFRNEIEGMRTFVEKLRRKYYVGYISNDAKEIASRCRKKFELNKLFQKGLLAYQVGARKDSPKLFLTLLYDVGMKAEECIFTDDTEANLEAAKKLGVNTILFKSKEQFVEEIRKLGVEVPE